MDITDIHCHSCTCEVIASEGEAFAYMSDGLKQGEWTFGSWDRRQIDESLFVGTSMFDGKETFIRIDTDPERFMIYYYLGSDPKHLVARNLVRIVPAQVVQSDAETCLVTLLAWRSAFMDDLRWKQLCVSHEAQMFIIKARIEAEKRSNKGATQ
jgi:hypothetical protein